MQKVRVAGFSVSLNGLSARIHTWHGEGIADRLMEWALNIARAAASPELYLTVFDHNERAKLFYTHYGFAEVGHRTFALGGIEHDHRVWCKQL